MAPTAESEISQLLHKINSQLTVVMGYAQLLQSNVQNPPESEWVAKIATECRHLIEELEKLKQVAVQHPPHPSE